MFERCPLRWLLEEATEEMALVRDYAFFRDHGVLPHGGGRRDQPARWIDALPTLSSSYADVMRDRLALTEAIHE